MAGRSKKFSLRAKEPEPAVVYYAKNPMADEDYDNFDQAPKQREAQKQGETTYQELSVSTMQVESLYTNKGAQDAQPYVEFTASDTHRVRIAEKVAEELEVGVSHTESVSKEGFVCYLVTMAVVMLVVLACFAAIFIEIADLKSTSEMTATQVRSVMLPSGGQNLNMSTSLTLHLQQLNQSLQSLNQRVAQEVERIENTLSMMSLNICTINSQVMTIENTITQNLTVVSQESATLQERNSQINESIDDLHQMLNQNELSFNQYQTTVSSCAALPPSSPSGYYWVSNSIGSTVRVYCDMTRSCGGITGGWTRVTELNTTSNGHQCPSGLTQRTDGDILTCVRDTSTAGCTSITLPTGSISYSRVCGRVTAYQIGSTDAFNNNQDINSVYADGIILTYGSPRQHIWTFVAALDRQSSVSVNSCPCQVTEDSATLPPSFVGNDYFCDAGISLYTGVIALENDPLWTDASCLCCTNPPWFHKQLPQPTTDDIEMRVCRDEESNNEDVAIQSAEIYIQ